MRTPRILGLGTYPIQRPVHGGQRRARAFSDFYASVGIDYAYASLIDARSYPQIFKTEVSRRFYLGPYDRKFRSSDELFHGAVGDFQAGLFARDHRPTRRFFKDLVSRFQPDAIQLEQPFLWALVEALRDDHTASSIPLIYSSQNIEAPLAKKILFRTALSHKAVQSAVEAVSRQEHELSKAASITVACSKGDADVLASMGAADCIVVENGIDRPPKAIPEERILAIKNIFDSRRFAFFVGSGYAPNVQGFCEYVIHDGLFTVPPNLCIAACGGAAHGIAAHPDYQAFARSNAARVHFFPDLDDMELSAIKSCAHAALLPVSTGGGSNLKTAEALSCGCWIVASQRAFRGFDEFRDEPGILFAENPAEFKRLIRQALLSDPLELGEAARARRSEVYWDRRFAKSRLLERLSTIGILGRGVTTVSAAAALPSSG